ncbi:MAG: glycosyltransferase [Chlamydiales bacterium]
MRYFLNLLIFLVFLPQVAFCDEEAQRSKTILMAILARNQEHVLPRYLDCIDKLSYDKQAITVYIHADQSEDRTQEILKKWADKNRYVYRSIIFENNERFNHFKDKPKNERNAAIRAASLQLVKEHHSDYYFVSDCDNFIDSYTLADLVSKDKPIIAPMLKAFPISRDPFSNFFCAVDSNGYYAHSEEYSDILNGNKKGTFEVPAVSRTYLVKADCIDKLTYADGTTNQYDFIVFSRCARNKGVAQYICNEKEYGLLLHLDEWEWPPPEHLRNKIP